MTGAGTAVRGESGDETEVPVLMYHSISDTSTQAFRPFTVAPQLFAEHLASLAEAGYACLTAAGLAQLRRRGRPPGQRSVVITVDDGFRDFADNALPALQAVNFSCTLFVPTGFVGGSSRWLVAEGEQQRRLLTWSELAGLPIETVECAAHGHSHQQMDLLSRAEAAREVALSKALLEDHLQRPITSFAFPFGYSRPAVREIVAGLGFAAGYAVADLISRASDDRYAIPRLTVTPDVTPQRLCRILEAPRTRADEWRSRSRAVASRALRQARLKKRENSPGRAPAAPSAP